MQATIVILIAIGMSVLFFTQWLPMVVTAVLVPVMLQLTGVLTAGEAWSGFSNATVISFIPIFTMMAVLKKSSFVARLQKYAHGLSAGKNGKSKVMIMLILATFLLTTFMNAASATTMMVPVIIGLAAEAGLNKRMALKLCGDVSSNGILVLPLGLTLSQYLTYNAYLEAGGVSESLFFRVMDQTIIKMPIFIVWLILMLTLGRKLLLSKPETVDIGGEFGTSSKDIDISKATTLTPTQDKLAIGLFFGSIVGMVIGVQFFKIPIYLTGSLFAAICFALKLITVNDAINSMSWISILIIAGTLPLATAFNKSGASDLFGNALSAMIGGSTNQYLLASIFFLVPALLTQLMSNTACAAVFAPLAVAAGVSLGVDPRFLLVASQVGAFSAFLTPMSTACEAVVFEAGKFKFGEFAKSGPPSEAN